MPPKTSTRHQKLVEKRDKLYAKQQKLNEDYKKVLDKLKVEKNSKKVESLERKKEKYEDKVKEVLERIKKTEDELSLVPAPTTTTAPKKKIVNGNGYVPIVEGKEFKDIVKKYDKEEEKKRKAQLGIQREIDETTDRENLLKSLEKLIENTKDKDKKQKLLDFYDEFDTDKGEKATKNLYERLEKVLINEDITPETPENLEKDKEQSIDFDEIDKEIDQYLAEKPEDKTLINRFRRDKEKHKRNVKKDFGGYKVGDQELKDANEMTRRPIKLLPAKKSKSKPKKTKDDRFKAISKIAKRSVFFDNLSEARYYDNEDEDDGDEGQGIGVQLGKEIQQKGGINWADLNFGSEDQDQAQAQSQQNEEIIEEQYRNILQKADQLKGVLETTTETIGNKMYKGFNLEPQVIYKKPKSKTKETSPKSKCDKHMNIVGNHICNRPDPNQKSRWLNRKTPKGRELYKQRIDIILDHYNSGKETFPFELLEAEKEVLSRI